MGKKNRSSGKSGKSPKLPKFATIRVEVYEAEDVVDAIVDDGNDSKTDRHHAVFGPDLDTIQAMADEAAGEGIPVEVTSKIFAGQPVYLLAMKLEEDESPTTNELTMQLIETLKRQLEELIETLKRQLEEQKEQKEDLELNVEMLQAENDRLKESYNVETLIKGLKLLLLAQLSSEQA